MRFNEAAVRGNNLPAETWLNILSKLETIELWERYEAKKGTIFLAALNLLALQQGRTYSGKL